MRMNQPEKQINTRVEKKKCPKCGWHKMWLPRGLVNTAYRFKCCKCGYMIK